MAISPEDRISNLEAKVSELYDREAIRDLRMRYHECINDGKVGEIPDLFSEDGELEFGHLGNAKGRDKIRESSRVSAACVPRAPRRAAVSIACASSFTIM